jgi:hypothetical protein
VKRISYARRVARVLDGTPLLVPATPAWGGAVPVLPAHADVAVTAAGAKPPAAPGAKPVPAAAPDAPSRTAPSRTESETAAAREPQSGARGEPVRRAAREEESSSARPATPADGTAKTEALQAAPAPLRDPQPATVTSVSQLDSRTDRTHVPPAGAEPQLDATGAREAGAGVESLVTDAPRTPAGKSFDAAPFSAISAPGDVPVAAQDDSPGSGSPARRSGHGLRAAATHPPADPAAPAPSAPAEMTERSVRSVVPAISGTSAAAVRPSVPAAPAAAATAAAPSLRIGTIEVRLEPPPASLPAVERPVARERLSRGFTSSLGLRQG